MSQNVTTNIQRVLGGQSIMFPDGMRVVVQQMRSYRVSGTSIVVEYWDGSTYSFDAGSRNQAASFCHGIDSAIQKGFGFFNIGNTSYT